MICISFVPFVNGYLVIMLGYKVIPLIRPEYPQSHEVNSVHRTVVCKSGTHCWLNFASWLEFCWGVGGFSHHTFFRKCHVINNGETSEKTNRFLPGKAADCHLSEDVSLSLRAGWLNKWVTSQPIFIDFGPTKIWGSLWIEEAAVDWHSG